MIVVSGCPRSGTSMMMRITEKVFGEDRILKGEKDPAFDGLPEMTEIESYLFEKTGQKERYEKQRDRTRGMNPNGYREMAFTVQGIYYRPQFEKLLWDDLTAIEPKIVKVVSQGLARSDPRHISKIIYMVRDPRAVAKSQENLSRNNPMNPEDAPTANGQKVRIRSVRMFNQVTAQAAKWINDHQDVPVMTVNYDNLLDNPAQILDAIQSFVGEGDFSQAVDMIDTSLRRSEPEDIEGEEAVFAMALYERLQIADFEGIIDAFKAKVEDQKANPPQRQRWFCPRVGSQVTANICELCKKHEPTKKNLIKSAKSGWRNEPCPYECGIQGGEGLSVAESIAANHWLVSTE